jgi:hypothetical protein
MASFNRPLAKGVHPMRGTGLCLMAVMFLSAIACADSIPTYNLTQGTVTVVSNIAGNSIGWSFTGANGVSASGNGNSGAGCANSAIAGSSCDPGLAITSSGPNLGSATGSSAVLFFTGVGVNISGPTFTLPQPGAATFTITLPVLFSGQFSACPWDVNAQACLSGSIGTFNVNGKGTATLTFANATANFPVWNLTGATYTLSSVPEPDSAILLSTGALAVIGRFLRRRS